MLMGRSQKGAKDLIHACVIETDDGDGRCAADLARDEGAVDGSADYRGQPTVRSVSGAESGRQSSYTARAAGYTGRLPACSPRRIRRAEGGFSPTRPAAALTRLRATDCGSPKPTTLRVETRIPPYMRNVKQN